MNAAWRNSRQPLLVIRLNKGVSAGVMDVQAAAQQLRTEFEWLVRRLVLYALPGLVDKSVRGLSILFLRACHEYLGAESRRPAGRSQFARLAR
ncbi:hypothetical protein [Streptomyces sp. NPDC047043]|uniref:hypothetical protein n=1 Tax=Streptomyces sp. NPDC047043 TaxID=3154497 RepID=UPI0033F85F68